MTRLYLGNDELRDSGDLSFAAGHVHQGFASKLFSLLDDPKPFERVTSIEAAHTILERFSPAGQFARSGLVRAA
ncbi:hypothetical protein HNP40_002984 [Mycobacteroides chelonae]|nr:hypothetical protein [Mycobacteroides chelonae]